MVYKLTKIAYNLREMAAKDDKATRYQIYLPESIHLALQKYIEDNFVPGSRVVTATIRNAIVTYLKARGYL